MKLHHAGALALVGWYFMFPPIDPASRFDPRFPEQQPDLNAPLDRWWIGDSFDTEEQCKALLAQTLDKTGFWSHSKCVSSDDPRLKGKKLNFVPESRDDRRLKEPSK